MPSAASTAATCDDADLTDAPLIDAVPGYEGSYLEFLGFEIAEHGDERARLEMRVRAEHRNTVGMVHGGVLMSLLDIAGAVAAHGASRGELVAITVSQTTSFVAAHRSDRVIAESRVVRRTRELAFCDSRIVDQTRGRVSATAQGVFTLKPRGAMSKAGKETR